MACFPSNRGDKSYNNLVVTDRLVYCTGVSERLTSGRVVTDQLIVNDLNVGDSNITVETILPLLGNGFDTPVQLVPGLVSNDILVWDGTEWSPQPQSSLTTLNTCLTVIPPLSAIATVPGVSDFVNLALIGDTFHLWSQVDSSLVFANGQTTNFSLVLDGNALNFPLKPVQCSTGKWSVCYYYNGVFVGQGKSYTGQAVMQQNLVTNQLTLYLKSCFDFTGLVPSPPGSMDPLLIEIHGSF
jgi:hypothetical protein